jgi:hypothetical protein
MGQTKQSQLKKDQVDTVVIEWNQDNIQKISSIQNIHLLRYHIDTFAYSNLLEVNGIPLEIVNSSSFAFVSLCEVDANYVAIFAGLKYQAFQLIPRDGQLFAYFEVYSTDELKRTRVDFLIINLP